MQEITHAEFTRYLRGYGTGVHCARYVGYYTTGDFHGEKFYYDRGCAIYIDCSDWDGTCHINVFVHQIAPDADIGTVAAEWKTKALEFAGGGADAAVHVVAFMVTEGELPPELASRRSFCNYVRRGFGVERDPRVRVLTPGDAGLVRAALGGYIESDPDSFGSELAEMMCDFEFDDERTEMTALFDEDGLAGTATRTYVPELDIAWLRLLYVVPEKRKKGIGRALVLSALCDWPEAKWHYQAENSNAPSVALARSLGFTLEGAAVF